MLDPEGIRAALARHPLRSIDPCGLRHSAVLLPLFRRQGEYWVLLTLRTEHLHHHRGEISFPGGRRNPEDPDLLATALRETEEELGLRPADVTVLGRLDDFISVHGYHVVPFVGIFPQPYPFRVNRGEIAEVIEVPLASLRQAEGWRKENRRHDGRLYPVHFFALENQEIWGLTAAILRQFLKRTVGRPE